MKHYKITGSEAGERLDKYLVGKIKDASRHGVKDLIDLGRVKVNGKRVVIAKWEVIEGDEVDVRLEGWTPGPQKRPEKEVSRERPRGAGGAAKVFIKIIYEDRDVLVVDKPAGVVVQAGSRHGGEATYVDNLRDYLRRKYKSKGAYVRPVHRLDRETSGLMVFAKSRVGEKLVDQFKRHAVERSYLAVVEGAVDKEQGSINLPIKKGDFGHGKRAGVGRGGEGSRSLTIYHVKERYGKATLLRLDLKTGRTHQARVHLAAVGHPIVGDRIYGGPGGIEFGRQALHSHLLAFRHPATGRQLKFRSDLPGDMNLLVDELRGK